MNRCITIPLFALGLLLFAGCGGGGGRYFPPTIAHNPYGISKSSFEVEPEDLEDKQAIARSRDRPKSVSRRIGGETYYHFQKVDFAGHQYTLAIPIDKWISLVDREDQVVARLRTPRYTRDAVAVELQHPERAPLLAILIDQQATSRSSTLYILDSSFSPVYREHLLEALWIAKTGSPSGDILFISTGERWRPHDEWIDVGGNWKYDVFREIPRLP